MRLRMAMIGLIGGLTACATTPPVPPAAVAFEQLSAAERAWLDAYDNNDREAMAGFLADGFTIVFPNGQVDTRADVIAGLDPTDAPDDGPSHYTDARTIRLIGDTAILSGIYIDPGDPGEADSHSHYTDTWMWLDGRWQVVASHLSHAAPVAAQTGSGAGPQ